MSDSDSRKKAGLALLASLRGDSAPLRGQGTPQLLSRVTKVGPITDPTAELVQLADATEQIKARVREVRAHLALPRAEACRVFGRELNAALARGETAHEALAKLRADRPDLAEAFKN